MASRFSTPSLTGRYFCAARMIRTLVSRTPQRPWIRSLMIHPSERTSTTAMAVSSRRLSREATKPFVSLKPFGSTAMYVCPKPGGNFLTISKSDGSNAPPLAASKLAMNSCSNAALLKVRRASSISSGSIIGLSRLQKWNASQLLPQSPLPDANHIS